MENKSICRKISSMLSLYIDNQVTYQESALIEEHLSNCPDCRAKYLYLQTLIKDLKSSYKVVLETTKKKQQQKLFNIREHEKFLSQLYPYVDNELTEEECAEFKNYMTKSENAQRELKNFYKVQKELKTSYDKIKKSFDSDFSQKIIDEIRPYDMKSAKRIVYLKKYISSKSVKIAVLFSLIIWGGYEAEMVYQQYHKTHNKTSVQRQAEKLSTKETKKETAPNVGF